MGVIRVLVEKVADLKRDFFFLSLLGLRRSNRMASFPRLCLWFWSLRERTREKVDSEIKPYLGRQQVKKTRCGVTFYKNATHLDFLKLYTYKQSLTRGKSSCASGTFGLNAEE